MTPIRNRTLTVAAIGSTVLAVSLLGLPSQAASTASPAHATRSRGGDLGTRAASYVDARQLHGSALAKADRRQVKDLTKADRAYYRSLGTQAVVSFDPLTGTVRDLGRLDGYLTGRSSAPARTVALSYVRSHLSALGLRHADLKTLRFRQDYVDSIGVHNLSWTQQAAGRTVFGNGLIVRVTRDGRVLAVQGSPVSDLTATVGESPQREQGDRDRRAHRVRRRRQGLARPRVRGGLPRWPRGRAPAGPTVTTRTRSGS